MNCGFVVVLVPDSSGALKPESCRQAGSRSNLHLPEVTPVHVAIEEQNIASSRPIAVHVARGVVGDHAAVNAAEVVRVGGRMRVDGFTLDARVEGGSISFCFRMVWGSSHSPLNQTTRTLLAGARRFGRPPQPRSWSWQGAKVRICFAGCGGSVTHT